MEWKVKLSYWPRWPFMPHVLCKAGLLLSVCNNHVHFLPLPLRALDMEHRVKSITEDAKFEILERCEAFTTESNDSMLKILRQHAEILEKVRDSYPDPDPRN